MEAESTARRRHKHRGAGDSGTSNNRSASSDRSARSKRSRSRSQTASSGPSLVVAYVLWAVGGLFGLHHMYLGRTEQATLWLQTLGLGLVGWARDAFVLPRYVAEATPDSANWEFVRAARDLLPKPRLSFGRLLCCYVVAMFYAWMGRFVFSGAEGQATPLAWAAAAAFATVGAALVGSVGYETVDLRYVAGGAAVGAAVLFSAPSAESVQWVAAGATIGAMMSRRHRKRRGVGSEWGMCRQLVFYGFAFWAFVVLAGVAVSKDPNIQTREQRENAQENAYAGGRQEDASDDTDWSEWFEDFADSSKKWWNDYMERMRMEEDPYEVLGVSKWADWAEVKSAYRELALKFHPDKNQGDEENAAREFLRVQKAYEALRKKMGHRKGDNSKAPPEEPSTSTPKTKNTKKKRKTKKAKRDA